MMMVNFGRFKGQYVRDLPTWYIVWLNQQKWIPIPLQREAGEEYAIRHRRHMEYRERAERQQEIEEREEESNYKLFGG